MKNSIPRPEYPRPQFRRENWQNLNGKWEFFNDLTASGLERKVYELPKLDGEITVPFCPESKLSGVGYTDFMPSVWYARNVTITKEQLDGRVLLHFGACDYITQIFVNGKAAGSHTGGYTSFSFDITDSLVEGDNRLVVHAKDTLRDDKQPCGKQSRKYYSHDCDYTRTTGIWQTVWLEFVPRLYLKNVRITATDLGGAVMFDAETSEYDPDAKLRIQAFIDGKTAADATFSLGGTQSAVALTVSPVKLWNAGEPNLYDVKFTLTVGGKAVDEAESYFGIRRIDIDGYKVRINGKSVFQRLILDQGFYPDGIYTAPSDDALKNDILLALDCGFNGARMHQKVFEQRYIYHADKMGYLLWGEYGSWGTNMTLPETLHTTLPQWLDSISRDYNSPSVIGWCPNNETWDWEGNRQLNTNISLLYAATKAVDRTRPVIDTSGNYHTENTDIFDVHDYCQSVETFRERYAERHASGEFFCNYADRQSYDGIKPYMVSEYGGIKWAERTKENELGSWGYGDAPATKEEFVQRYCGLAEAVLDAPNIMGFCYTQLTDVEQEQNGLYYYDRSLKFSKEQYAELRRATSRPAAVEKE